MFINRIINNKSYYNELKDNLDFDNITKGRIGSIIVDSKTKPAIVRTTTVYNKPASLFKKIHKQIICDIKSTFRDYNVHFNNAMVELYTPEYKKMGFHTDQTLDLDNHSYICIFSTYENNSDDPNDHRTLIVKNKESGKITKIKMKNNCAILFSVEENKKHVHKIVLESNSATSNWIGVTLRLSKTYIDAENFTIDNIPLTLATDEEKKQFMIMKSKENKEIDWNYPTINFTISPSDLMKVV